MFLNILNCCCLFFNKDKTYLHSHVVFAHYYASLFYYTFLRHHEKQEIQIFLERETSPEKLGMGCNFIWKQISISNPWNKHESSGPQCFSTECYTNTKSFNRIMADFIHLQSLPGSLENHMISEYHVQHLYFYSQLQNYTNFKLLNPISNYSDTLYFL